MQIKYKGNTGALLAELSLELKQHIDLKASEEILTSFFRIILSKQSPEIAIKLINTLPAGLKQFCINKNTTLQEQKWSELYFQTQKNITINIISKVLEKYIPADNMDVIRSCYPENSTTYSYCKKKTSTEHYSTCSFKYI